ncbi:ATP-binding protein [Streptomyces sp. NBS 14/10]|uniref:ATP-binding protein n=1 Tax=Streptomyces sp. NBS 14/10 TaxID=1945643 RepID=UPI000B802C25|nr:ATP-binding protein [Streptomyces sp. NBS 14/10]KAK1182180.1 ATP-binding protein [Streptomyces sp. NBS 14/10]
MDPTNRGPEEHGRDTPTPHPAESGSPAPAPVRTVQLVSGDHLLTINPVDGSEIAPCPPGRRPAHPERRGPDDRAELRRAAAPPLPAGAVAFEVPMLEREDERERLARLLARGRSVRVTGPSGAGRSTLLDAVAADCEDLAPDGVVRLSGYRRTATDLLYELYAAVYRAPLYRPGRPELLAAVAEVGAVVVLDDIEFGGAALDEFLDATPECAFLISATPAVAAPSTESHLEEVFLSGLSRTGSLELLERAVRRPLAEDERDWAADLWFESEGLPLRFIQAGALLRQRDALRGEASGSAEEVSGSAEGSGAAGDPDAEGDASAETGVRDATSLPTLAEGAAPVALIASRLSEAAQDTLRFAVALGGECPHQTHLPALAGDTHADAALVELIAGGLVTPAGPHYRLAVGVADQLAAVGYADGTADRAGAVARHYAWWAGHPSVAPERVAVEADAVLAAMAALVAAREAGRAETAVLLARSATPAFAAALHWGAWERALRHGQEAARLAGQVAEEAYFHHELGVLALCTGNLDRARAELEASIGLRGVLADKRGTVAGRRALALVTDRSGGPAAAGVFAAPGGRTTAGEEATEARHDESASPPGGVPAARQDPADTEITVVTPRVETTERLSRTDVLTAVGTGGTGDGGAWDGGTGGAGGIGGPGSRAGGPGGGRAPHGRRFAALTGARRNLVAAGAGALLVAVLGTVVTIGITSGDGDKGSADTVKPSESTSRKADDDKVTAEEPTSGVGESGQPGPSGVPGAPTSPSTLVSGSPSASQSPTAPSSSGTASPTGKPTTTPPTSGSTTQTPTHRPTTPTTPPTTPTTKPPTTKPPTTTPPTSSTTSPGGDTTNTASGPATTASSSTSAAPTSSASSASSM